jgi:hypothetical protein
MLKRSLILAGSLFMLGSPHAMTISENIKVHSGMQLYKADRVFEFLSRMERSAAKVQRLSQDTTNISFTSNHLGLVDSNLHQLISRHPREIKGTSVTYFGDDLDSLKNLRSVKLLKSLGANVILNEGTLPCKVNKHSCKIFVIQFYATRLGGVDE